MRIKCPYCKAPTTWEENPNRPFCSERCRLSDLGLWANESYSFAGQSAEADTSNDTEDEAHD